MAAPAPAKKRPKKTSSLEERVRRRAYELYVQRAINRAPSSTTGSKPKKRSAGPKKKSAVANSPHPPSRRQRTPHDGSCTQ